MMKKKHWVLALAVSLGAIGAPAAASAAGGDETRSAYERAVKLVEAADYEDALEQPLEQPLVNES